MSYELPGLPIHPIYETRLWKEKYLDPGWSDIPGRLGPLVFVNGCFDLFHAGHAFILQTAFSGGKTSVFDRLVVALNSDESVRRRKKRLFNELVNRMYTVMSVGVVDYVTWFDEDTPKDLLARFKPHTWIHGYDPDNEPRTRLPEHEDFGGEIFWVPNFLKYSTTLLIDRIKAT